jgi:hypothetical protein
LCEGENFFLRRGIGGRRGSERAARARERRRCWRARRAAQEIIPGPPRAQRTIHNHDSNPLTARAPDVRFLPRKRNHGAGARTSTLACSVVLVNAPAAHGRATLHPMPDPGAVQ